VALLLAAGAGLHLAALPEHADYLPYAAFFVGVAALELAAAILILARPTWPLQRAIIAGNVMLLAIWALTRTLGVPIGPEAGHAHAVGVLDASAALSEMAAVAGLVVVCSRRFVVKLGTLGVTAALTVTGGLLVFSPSPEAHVHSDAHAHAHAHP
jgi:hypothetical protein